MAKHTAKSFSRALADLAKVPAKIAPKVARRIAKDIQQNFALGEDPYRRPWAPLRPATLAKGRQPPPLTDTEAGRRGVNVTPNASGGIRLVNYVDYMGIHQAGDLPRMVARKFFPEGVLPKQWRVIWDEELTKAQKARLSRG